jgi:hypothetical protein
MEKYKIIICSPPNYDNLVAEIFFEEKFVVLVSQEISKSNFELEFPGINLDESQILRKVDVGGFSQAITQACAMLNE